MFNWIFTSFLAQILGSQKVKLAMAGTLTALAFKLATYVSAHLGLLVTPDAAFIQHFVDWIFALTATMIAGHTVQTTFGPDVPPPPQG